MRIAVAGAMASGKSTFLNALAGQEVLPIRHVAMTCMPTRLELADAATLPEPVLFFPDDLLRRLTSACHLLRAVRLDGDTSRLVNRHVHLTRLLTAVRAGAVPDVPPVITGADRIRSALTQANDLFRLAILARPPAVRSLLDTPEPPSVRVPFPGCLRAPVVLADTPGPDQAGAAELPRLFAREIERAQAAFLILDFTRLETTVSVRSLHLVKEHPRLFAEGGAIIVNRADQRRTGDRDEHAVRRFVAHHAGRADLPVLETSARHALAAAAYLGAEEARCQYAAQDLLGLCYPGAAPGELAGLTPHRIRDLAVRQLEGSGIRTVRRLMEDPAPLEGRAAQ